MKDERHNQTLVTKIRSKNVESEKNGMNVCKKIKKRTTLSGNTHQNTYKKAEIFRKLTTMENTLNFI